MEVAVLTGVRDSNLAWGIADITATKFIATSSLHGHKLERQRHEPRSFQAYATSATCACSLYVMSTKSESPPNFFRIDVVAQLVSPTSHDAILTTSVLFMLGRASPVDKTKMQLILQDVSRYIRGQVVTTVPFGVSELQIMPSAFQVERIRQLVLQTPTHIFLRRSLCEILSIPGFHLSHVDRVMVQGVIFIWA